MATSKNPAKIWKFRNRKVGFEATGTLVAVWEVSLDPMSDDFSPSDITAQELFARWSRRVSKDYPNGLVPIHWFVDVAGGEIKTFEYMPFQFDHLPRDEKKDFLTFFTWPTNVKTGEPLNWMELPVVDKLWGTKRADKGGFIQEATHWKPSIFQPYVYLPSLEKAVSP